MEQKELAIIPAAGSVWRVGFRPPTLGVERLGMGDEWPFPGRWDDLHGNFRTVYAGSSLKACLLEVLTGFRRDARLAAELEKSSKSMKTKCCTRPSRQEKFRVNGWSHAPRPAPNSPGTTAPSPPPKPSPSCTRTSSLLP